jgi:hypothetical protein
MSTTCYVGCQAPTTGIASTPGIAPTSSAASHTQTAVPLAQHATPLAFTGADLAELFVIAVIAIAVGFALWASSRRRHV